MRLNQLKIGEKAVIKDIKCGNLTIKKLTAMGLVKGEIIQIIRRAPLKDPIEIKINNLTLAIRNKQANEIMVEVIEQ